MRIDEPHLSINPNDNSSFLFREIEKTKESIRQLTESKNLIEMYLQEHSINNENLIEKITILSDKIRQLNNALKDFQKVIDNTK
jgi:hypothetical protein